ncbi:hypothetical protein HFO09_14065 [Rhizobium laguerreae]|uniref:phage major capsid protein n=1 Tax=Rhizobium laguerreae TaxID=1076926 RepID=UPI001C9062DB|nr:hypothetical protein [Rhizobium laguerreae]MBY3254533.1 hypothetical protein [Rhizobium laguerreae]MBY3283850.1 hypothetical protein [Rhizobium laguerreae]MBY3290192.1 hypothetical protein [Rhizobium laguerreae]
MTRKYNIMGFVLTMAVAVIACVGLTSEAYAAVPHLDFHSAGSLFDAIVSNPHVIVAGPLAVMRADLEALHKRAKDKAAEVKDGLDETALRKIEDEYTEIIGLIEAKAVEIRNLEWQDDRIITIRSISASAGLADFGEEHVQRETPVDEFRSILLGHLAAQDEQTRINSNTRVDVGRGNDQQRAAAIHNALMHRASPADVELTAEGRNFRGMTLLDMARDVLEANGISTRGMSRQELAAQALVQRSGGGLHSTSDFPGILSNVAHTTLRAAYTAAPQTFRPLIRETSVPDFKPVTRAQLGEAPALNKVNEHGEFKRGTLTEGKESYRIATYGKIVGITRQVIINDDLDAFSRLPAAFGIQAAQLESDLVWAQILTNPNMGDGKSLFHADHSNIMTASAIGLTSMSNGRTLFAQQTGLDGRTIIGLSPSYLLVPVALHTVAEQFISQIYPAKTSDAVPDGVKRVQIIAEGRLDVGIDRPEDDIVAVGSAAAWYLAGTVAQTDIVELAYLEGNRGVYTEQRVGFDIDGVEIKVRLDVGAKVMDWRNIAKNPGA